MLADLGREALVRRLPSLHAARAEELGNAGDIARAVMQLLLDLAAIRPDELRVGALHRALARELRDRCRARRHAGVAPQPLERVLLARWRVALVEQHLQPLEHLARQIPERHEQALLERRG